MNPVIQTNKKTNLPLGKIILLSILLVVFAFVALQPNVAKLYVNNIAREVLRSEMSVTTWNWNQIEGKHFIVRYKNQDQNAASIVLNDSEKNFVPVTKRLGYVPKEKILVIVYPDKQSLNKSFGWDANESAMGVYWEGVIRVLSPNSWIKAKNPTREGKIFAQKGPMAHEFTHLVIDYITRGNYTRWFTEGVAQYNEYLITGFKLPLDTDTTTHLYPLKDMDDNFDNLPDQGLAYRESLVAIDYFVDQYGMDKLNSLMTELGKGYSMDGAMKKVIGVGLDKFESNWHQWLQNNSYEMS